MTLGWRRGFKRNARKRLTTRIRVVWTMSNGNAKSKGLSPCHTPLEEVFIDVIFTPIFGYLCKTNSILIRVVLQSWKTNYPNIQRGSMFSLCSQNLVNSRTLLDFALYIIYKQLTCHVFTSISFLKRPFCSF